MTTQQPILETTELELMAAPLDASVIVASTPTIEFESATYTMNEEEELSLVVTLTRTGNTSSDSFANLEAVGGSATLGIDYGFNNLIYFAEGQTSQVVEVFFVNDLEDEGTETIELQLVDGQGNDNYVVGTQNTTTIDLLASAPPHSSQPGTPTVEFESATYTTNEDGEGSLLVTVTRTGDTSSDSSVNLEAVGGSATLGIDYNFDNLIYFAEGQTSQVVEVFLVNDLEDEGTETIELQLVDGQGNDNYVVGTQNTTTIDLLDSAPPQSSQPGTPTVEFESATYTMNEDGEGSLLVTVTRTGDTSSDSSVNLEAVGGSATFGSDYDFTSSIYFAEGQTSQVVDVVLSNDSEVEGIETIDLQILEGTGGDNYLVGNQDITTVNIVDNDVVIAEIGEVTNLTHESQTIFLDHNFVNPVVFAQPLSYNDADPAIVRITDIQSDRFSVQVQETTLINGNSHDGTHPTESFSFLVVEQGVWELSNGSILEVGNVTTNAITTSSWERIEFNHDFTDTPVVLTQVQTDNDATFVRTRQDNATNNRFDVALEEEEAFKSSGHGTETIAWLAISPGEGTWDGNQFIAGNTGDQVTHNWHTLDFGNNFTNAPTFLGNIASFDGRDSSGLRYQNLTNGNVQIMVEEDTSQDMEIRHTTEDINFLAIEADGNLTGSLDSLTGLVTQETGTINADTFILGDEFELFYENYGQQDYAEISGFELGQDLIQLHGLVDDYYIGSSPSGTNDQGIFLEVAGMEDELVGIVKNTTGLDINSSSFTFV